MIDAKMQSALNEQINREFYSAYLYLAMANWCEDQNLPGFAGWLSGHAQEEWGHGMKIRQHILDNGGSVVLRAIVEPPSGYDSLVAVFEATLEHEQHITGCIHDLYASAVDTKDYSSQVMLQWFVQEQVEEEKTVTDILNQVRMVKDAPGPLLSLDRAMGSRGGA